MAWLVCWPVNLTITSLVSTEPPCARLLLRHPLAQRIPTEACECSVSLALCAGREFSGARNWRLIDGPRKGLPSLCSRLLLSPQCFDLLFGFTGLIFAPHIWFPSTYWFTPHFCYFIFLFIVIVNPYRLINIYLYWFHSFLGHFFMSVLHVYTSTVV